MVPVGLFLLVAATGFAQIIGSITGTVTDETGSVVPNVAVDAINADTNVRFSARTSATGYFAIHLPPGKYELDVRQAGFKKFSQKGLEVSNDTTLRTDVKLIRDDRKLPQPIPPVAAVPDTHLAFARVTPGPDAAQQSTHSN
jgi:hypothetical protein